MSPSQILHGMNDCVDTGRSTGGNLSMAQGGAADYSSHLPLSVAISSGEAEYISAVCMKASFLMMLAYDLIFLGSDLYDGDILKCEPSRKNVDNEATISMVQCNKDTAGNRHMARRYHYVR